MPPTRGNNIITVDPRENVELFVNQLEFQFRLNLVESPKHDKVVNKLVAAHVQEWQQHTKNHQQDQESQEEKAP